LISSFAKDAKTVSKSVSNLLEALLSSKILDTADIETVILGRQQPVSFDNKETKKFVCTRLQVLFDNLIEQVTEVDHFDFVSRILLDMYSKFI
jgi:hypothetical protein